MRNEKDLEKFMVEREKKLEKRRAREATGRRPLKARLRAPHQGNGRSPRAAGR